MIDEDSPHQLRCDAKEVSAILPMYVLLIHELQIGFVDQRCSLQRMSWPLVSQVPRRLLPQLLINQREQCVEGFLISVAPTNQQLSYVLGCLWHAQLPVQQTVTPIVRRCAEFRSYGPNALGHTSPYLITRASGGFRLINLGGQQSIRQLPDPSRIKGPKGSRRSNYSIQ